MSLYETPATSAHAPNLSLKLPAFAQDFEARETTLPTIHAHGLTQQPSPDFKPYVYGASSAWARQQLERANENFGRFTNP